MSGEHAIEAGGQIGPYVLHALIGRGGMGEVWRAADTVREREVALKLISPSASQDAAVATRFRRECRLAARLSSAHVVPIHDFGEIDDRLYLDMRLVPGPDLRSVLDRHPEGLDPEAVRDVIVQVADALDAAHDLELVHRDVKPSNVLVDVSRGRWFCYLADFGVAVPFDAGPDTRITRTGMTIGTPTYMAPELLIGDGRASVATDVYALGCLLHELLTGTPPYSGANDAAVLFAHAHAEPPRPSAHRPWLAGFDPVVRAALAKDPAQRYASAGELARALPPSPVLPAAGPQATFVGAPPPPRRRGRRRLLWAGLALLLLAGLGVGGYALARTTGIVETPPTQVTARRLAAFTGTYGVVSSPDGRSAYMLGEDDQGHALFVVDAVTGATTARIPAQDGTTGIVLSPDGARAYLVGTGYDKQPGNTVQVVDVPGQRAVATIATDGQPNFAALSGDGSRLVVTVRSADPKKPGKVVVVDTARNLVVGSVPVGITPYGVAVSPDGRQAYVANYGSGSGGSTGQLTGSLSVVDVPGGRVERTVPVGAAPYEVKVSPDGRTVYVTTNTNASPGTLDVLDTTAFGRTQLPVPTSFYPADSALSPDGSRLLLTNFGTEAVPGRTVTIMDLEHGTALPFAEIEGQPNRVGVTPDDHHAFVTTFGSSGNSLWFLEFP